MFGACGASVSGGDAHGSDISRGGAGGGDGPGGSCAAGSGSGSGPGGAAGDARVLRRRLGRRRRRRPTETCALRAAFKVQDGKLGGTIESSMGAITVVTSAFADDKLTLTIDLQGGAATLGCKLQGNRIEGSWEVGSDTGRSGWHGPGSGRRERRRSDQRDLGRGGRDRRSAHAVLDGTACERRHRGGRDDFGCGKGAAHERHLEGRHAAAGVPVHRREPVSMGAKIETANSSAWWTTTAARPPAPGPPRRSTAPRSVGQAGPGPRCERGVEIDDGDDAESGAIADREPRVPDDDPPPAVRERQHLVARKPQPRAARPARRAPLAPPRRRRPCAPRSNDRRLDARRRADASR